MVLEKRVIESRSSRSSLLKGETMVRTFTIVVCAALIGAGAELRAAEADQSSPKATMHAFWSAIDAGDAAAAEKLSVGAGDAEKRWIEAYAGMCDGFKRLHDAAVKRFGKDAERQFMSRSPAYFAAGNWERSEEREQGGSTQLVRPGGRDTEFINGITLVQKDGKWVVSLSGAAAKPSTMVAKTSTYQTLATSMRQVAADIDAGRFATAAEAQQAQRDAMRKLRPIPTSAPAGRAGAATRVAGAMSLAEARRGFHTKLIREEHEDEVPDPPPADVFRLVQYQSPAGSLAAYLSVAPKDQAKHPAIIWLVGGFDNSIGDTAWKPAPANNDQSGSAFRRAGLIMMYPSLRGGNKNPGFKEQFLGEVDDVLAAADFLAKQDFVDPKRIYLGGHSTGGTLALLTAECSERFRAVFCFGPVSAVQDYGKDRMVFDPNVREESLLRSPGAWLTSVRSPVFVLEGTGRPGNIGSLALMAIASRNPLLHFHQLPGLNHFTELAPATKLIAAKLLADNGPSTNVNFSEEELAGLASSR